MSNSYNHNGTEFGITSGNLQAGSTPAAVAVDAFTLGRVINQSPYMVERACCSPMWWP